LLTLAFGRTSISDVGDVMAFKAETGNSTFGDYYSWTDVPTKDEK
jgi:hypothetical protein